jgi:hypothetical protein
MLAVHQISNGEWVLWMLWMLFVKVRVRVRVRRVRVVFKVEVAFHATQFDDMLFLPKISLIDPQYGMVDALDFQVSCNFVRIDREQPENPLGIHGKRNAQHTYIRYRFVAYLSQQISHRSWKSSDSAVTCHTTADTFPRTRFLFWILHFIFAQCNALYAQCALDAFLKKNIEINVNC